MKCSYDLRKDYPLEEIRRIHVPTLAEADAMYPQFYEEFLEGNTPCIVTSAETSTWPAFKDWVTPDGNVNVSFLRDAYGNVEVPVTEIKNDMTMEYGGMQTTTKSVNDYLEYWETYVEQGYPSTMPCLYLKDWHILRNSGNAKTKPYETLKFFSSDWLNETCDKNEEDDFRFAYMGPKGSWTPFHADVYGSFSWSVNICGEKLWRLYPPGEEDKFMQEKNGRKQLIYDYLNPGVEGKDYIEVIQVPGETIFVPSGWHHVVWNTTDCISINHNWFNGSNICYIWKRLKIELEAVEEEIKELRDMDEFENQCQLILEANHGMDFQHFFNIVKYIWNNREEKKGQLTTEFSKIRHLLEHVEKDASAWTKEIEFVKSFPMQNW